MNADDKLLLFEEYYEYLESSFIDVTKMIPLENTTETFSPRLYEILHSVCSQIEGVLKLICGEVDVAYTNFPETYAKLNQDGAVNRQAVVLKFRPKWKSIRPFQCDFGCHCRETDEHPCDTEREKPKWWDAYNESKHELPEGYRVGNIENTYLALASLYVLQHMAWSRKRNPDGFLKQGFWSMTNAHVFGVDKPRFHERHTASLPSNMFIALAWLMADEL